MVSYVILFYSILFYCKWASGYTVISQTVVTNCHLTELTSKDFQQNRSSRAFSATAGLVLFS